ncbi:organic hydroperoxide resistance protein [Flavobacterium suaedae]|uniref:Organic hydroperoxide resistance protein n=1 Tax=Flavobacterium suaedae TaxID=1767027 RepID=A0ABQ1JXS2_9FLAO|nr:organic hydroperoxide resistance protein [Flavobacterium suaedae]GGB80648.1 organic hydroperoxide resistance protein [Flavobacterium suaedae]
MKTLYQTSATVTGGRNGHVKSHDGVLDVKVRIPKEMGGEGGATNPEQLFAAGYAACFDSALNLIINKEKVETTSSSEVTATVAIGPNDDGGYQLAVKLTAKIPGVEKEKAQELIEKAHAVCPYSNATRGNIEVELEIQ